MAEVTGRMRESEPYLAELERCAGYASGIDRLRGKSVFVTGAGGLICSALTDVLLFLNDRYGYGITVYAAVRDTEKTRCIFAGRGGGLLNIVPYDACSPLAFGGKADFYVHGAGNASPDLFMSQPVETMTANFLGLGEILAAAARTGGRVLYISSSEVYGLLSTDRPIREDEQGYVDPGSPRSCYAASKRAAETLCAAYRKEYGADYVVARPGHIYGPTAGAGDVRASSDFLRRAAAGEDIVLRSRGSQLRSYCCVFDCVIQLLTVLLAGESGEAYNISNPRSRITVAEMAHAVARLAGVRCLCEPRPDERDNPMRNSSLSSGKFASLLGMDERDMEAWGGCLDAEEGFARSLRMLEARESAGRNDGARDRH